MSGADQSWKVVTTRLADQDILGIIAFIGERERPDMAEIILEKFIQARDSLSKLPERGRIPPEMKKISILSYREIQAAPYRMVYQVNQANHTVYIHLVADGRRNMAELLKERLLGPVEYKKQ
ncbi:MAG: type II toxin-antitoxin system RelE/ParE family toxin [Deltaproteobacteria bacterium]|jgi:plasmid stabilization system protein ParE|nr:type II toxin-antitoxin system RelE/ParE family toxin [Deltaproteobacteria bacterium]